MLNVSTIGASTLELDHATIDYTITSFIKSMDLVGAHASQDHLVIMEGHA